MRDVPRLRMIAGPNASGKTTLTKFLLTLDFNFGDYINADDLELELRLTGKLNFDRYKLDINQQQYKTFFENHPLCPVPFKSNAEISENCLYMNGNLADGYYSAILADFIRQQMINTGRSLTFETVMSGADKIDLLKSAKEKGYRNYLYYICTENVLINKERNENRVTLGGHGVPEGKIGPRYDRSLGLLLQAIKLSDRAYLFDNSGAEHIFIAEVTDGKQIELKTRDIPGWFVKSVYDKIKQNN